MYGSFQFLKCKYFKKCVFTIFFILVCAHKVLKITKSENDHLTAIATRSKPFSKRLKSFALCTIYVFV